MFTPSGSNSRAPLNGQHACEIHCDAHSAVEPSYLDCTSRPDADVDELDNQTDKANNGSGCLSMQSQVDDVCDEPSYTTRAAKCYIPALNDPVDVALAAALRRM